MMVSGQSATVTCQKSTWGLFLKPHWEACHRGVLCFAQYCTSAGSSGSKMALCLEPHREACFVLPFLLLFPPT